MFSWTRTHAPPRRRAKALPEPDAHEARRVRLHSRQDEIDLLRELQLLDLTIPPWLS
jgi:hypothetical protein